MKKNKLLIILLILAAVLVFGAVFAISRNVADADLYTVRIDYVIDGESKPFKTVIEEFEAGATANIAAPTKPGYQPRQASFVAIVNSDYVVTVVYDCLHASGYDLGTVISYPTDTEDGVMEYKCLCCGREYYESFTSLSRSCVFGGDNLAEVVEYGKSANGYALATSASMITLSLTSVPEWNVFIGYGIQFESGATLPDCIEVSIEYDTSVWGETLSFARSKNASYDAEYRLRLANSNTVMLVFEAENENVCTDFIYKNDCPLLTSPIKVTLTYDWRK